VTLALRRAAPDDYDVIEKGEIAKLSVGLHAVDAPDVESIGQPAAWAGRWMIRLWELAPHRWCIRISP
jgi:hypothetical protein